MTSVQVEHLAVPSSFRAERALDVARERAADALAGRTVWCATALPSGRASARSLRAHLDSAGRVTAGSLEVPAAEPLLRDLAGRLDSILRGAVAGVSRIGARPATSLGPAEEQIYAQGRDEGEALVGPGVGPGDVLVLHDALTAVLAEAARDRGAHVIWDVKIGGTAREDAALEVWDFLRRQTSAIDAFVMTWFDRDERGRPVEGITAVMPSADMVATRELPAGEEGLGGRLHEHGWSCALADVVRNDRGETVGGTFHPRPAVAPR